MSEEEKRVEEEMQEAPIFGDLLDSIISHVPLIDLLPASQVSHSWKRAVSLSLRRPNNKLKPWLILHAQSTREPLSVNSAYAYDPRSKLWVHIEHQPSIKSNSFSALRSSHSTLLYMLSPSNFSFSLDPLHLSWHQADPPTVWRVDPIVAVVGYYAIVAGGAYEFEDDRLAVEMYDTRSRTWETCESMPETFMYSASSIWVSVAVDSSRMYVLEKIKGIMYWFDPCTKIWHGPCNLRQNDGESVYCCCIGFASGRLILVGIIEEENENSKRLKLWEVYGDSWEKQREITEMPKEMVEKMIADDDFSSASNSSVGVTIMGDLVFVYNNSKPEELFFFEINGTPDAVTVNWVSVENAAVDKIGLIERVVVSCSDVGIPDLRRAASMSVKVDRLQ
ncbi:hypothetical protein HS088_TW06G00758 [Tripterygium wilfordii]|uniref:F-box domain-containing protein n=2 Tax=Tripterygium wilfordii TaxID=458696 RepID=A0A7J7DJT3_TRIWF|nr:hypothetical protein HS088_TW06G00758 [Tripterygium wilfordii]